MNTDQQNPPLQPPNIPQDSPMDEFETAVPKNPLKNKNILKLIKISALAIFVMIIVLVGVSLFRSIPNITNQPTAKPTFIASPTTVPTPTIEYPAEYQSLSRDILEYDKSTSTVPESRTRLDFPQIDPTTSF